MSIEIVRALRLAKGSNKKLSILKAHSGNELWKQYLLATYDSSLNYYISAPVDNMYIDDCDVAQMLEDSGILSARVLTGNRAKKWAWECSRRHGELFRLLLKGSINANVSVTTINKAYPGLIPTFKVMLAQNEVIEKYPVWASVKYDGVRVTAFVTESKVTLKTRAGKTLHIDSLIRAMQEQPIGVYDGELVSGDGKQIGRTVITGQVNKILKGTAIDIADFTFCIFDFIPYADWEQEDCSLPYSARYLELTRTLKEGPEVSVVRQVTLNNETEVDKMYEYQMALGFEGLICRYPGDRYEWRRTSKLIKKKSTISCVLHCVGVTEGTGKYDGLIGAFMCEGKVNEKEVRVKVGSGLSDFDREQTEDHYIGKDLEILYNDVILAKDAECHSLFLPRFKRIVGDHNV